MLINSLMAAVWQCLTENEREQIVKWLVENQLRYFKGWINTLTNKVGNKNK